MTAAAELATKTREREESSPLLDQIMDRQAIAAERYMPTLTVRQFTEREKMLRELKDLLVEGTDYGVIPGTQKPTLLKPGAEKICAFFGYAPHYTETCIEDWKGERFGEPLFYYKYTCVLAKDKSPVGEGIGSASTWESKYRYRSASKKCPACGAEAIIKGKEEYGGGWLCFGKKGGCGAKYKDGDGAIESQSTGKVSNPDIADVVNTVQKMGQKRAYIAATLSATGASQYFTQDVEDADTAAALGIDTGGHPVGTAAARDFVRDQKLDQAREQQQQKRPAPTSSATGVERPRAAAQSAPATNPAPAPTAIVPGQQAPASAVPEEIAALWQRMGVKISSIYQEFDALKRDFGELTGSEASYYAILAKHGWKHRNDLRTEGIGGVNKARLIARELFELLQAAQREMSAPVEEDRNDWLPDGFGEVTA